MPTEPIVKKTLELPFDYTITFRASPHTIRKTIFRLLPWAIVAMLPGSSRSSRIVKRAATFVSPLVKQRMR